MTNPECLARDAGTKSTRRANGFSAMGITSDCWRLGSISANKNRRIFGFQADSQLSIIQTRPPSTRNIQVSNHLIIRFLLPQFIARNDHRRQKGCCVSFMFGRSPCFPHEPGYRHSDPRLLPANRDKAPSTAGDFHLGVEPTKFVGHRASLATSKDALDIRG